MIRCSLAGGFALLLGCQPVPTSSTPDPEAPSGAGPSGAGPSGTSPTPSAPSRTPQRSRGSSANPPELPAPTWAEPHPGFERIVQAIVADFGSVAPPAEDEAGTALRPPEVAKLDAWLDPDIGLWVRWNPTHPADVIHYRSFGEPQLVIRQLIAMNAQDLPRQCARPRRGPLHRGCENRFDLGLPDACYVGGVGEMNHRNLANQGFGYHLWEPATPTEAAQANAWITHFIFSGSLGIYFGWVRFRWRIIAVDIEDCDY